MTQISMKTTLSASSKKVWETIRDFGRVGEYVTTITQTKTEGSGIGALRTLSLRNEVRVVERLESLDDEKRTLSYSVLETPLAMKGYVATMKLRELGGGQCELVWESTFQAEASEEARIKKAIERLYSLGFEGLKKLHEEEKYV